MKFALGTLLLASAALLINTAEAQTAASSSASAPAKPAKKKAKKIVSAAPADPDEAEPDITGTVVSDYQCELGAKLTIYQNKDDADHAAIRWGKRLHRMERVSTTTGADRFENKHYGLVWIGIPAKGILLDSKTGHQLANECRTAEQVAAQEAAKAAAAAQKAAAAADKAVDQAAAAADKAAVAADKATDAANKAAAAAAEKTPAGQTTGK